ncbi:MAG TPA: alpha/beta fold hydrolase [Firmicutes bacterium]|nr:alpha/beta fold hydrolase [Bacillota bacterium]
MRKRISWVLLSMVILSSFIMNGCAQPESGNAAENVSSHKETVLETGSGSDILEPSQAVSESMPAASDGTGRNLQVSDQPIYEYETQDVYATRDGNQIYGVMYIPQHAGEQMPAIIYSYGFGGSYRYGLQYAEAMAARGYVVYCFDFCGGSPGSRSDGSQYEMSIFTEQQDLQAVISMMQGLDYVDSENLFLLGTSQGGAVSAITAADNQDKIAGAVLLYPAFVLVDDAMERFDSIEEVPETYQHMFMTVGRAYFEGLFDYDIYADIEGFDKDVLIIHGDADNIVPLSYSERAVEVYSSAELEVIHGAGHGFSGEAAQAAIDYMTEYYHSHVH